MRYDHMVELYPHIDSYCSKVTDMIRAGGSVEMALHMIGKYIDWSIPPLHREAVTAKLQQWALVMVENRTHPRQDPAQPDLCVCCGSLDTVGGVCRWCGGGKNACA